MKEDRWRDPAHDRGGSYADRGGISWKVSFEQDFALVLSTLVDRLIRLIDNREECEAQGELLSRDE